MRQCLYFILRWSALLKILPFHWFTCWEVRLEELAQLRFFKLYSLGSLYWKNTWKRLILLNRKAKSLDIWYEAFKVTSIKIFQIISLGLLLALPQRLLNLHELYKKNLENNITKNTIMGLESRNLIYSIVLLTSTNIVHVMLLWSKLVPPIQRS